MNKLETRVEARWNVRESASLTDAERSRLLEALAPRLTAAGVLRVTSQRFRTQAANRRAALERLRELVRNALRTPRVRRATSVPESAHEARVAAKKRRSRLKRLRGGRPGDEPDCDRG